MGHQSKPPSTQVETPSKRLANLLKDMVRDHDRCDREAAHRKPQPKERDVQCQLPVRPFEPAVRHANVATREEVAKRAAEISAATSHDVADVWQYRRETKAIVARTIAILSVTVQHPETPPVWHRRRGNWRPP